MSGTKEGGLKASQTNREKHGEDFYKRIGALSHDSWIKNGKKPRGFAADKELARTAGKKGGETSRRGKSYVG